MSIPLRLHASLTALKQPAYTGQNRCIPCTFLNIVIALIAGIAVALGIWFLQLGSPSIAAVSGATTVAAGLAIIYVRGYLIPGTPTFTKRYFPAWLLAVFDKQPVHTLSEELVPEELLLDIGIVIHEPGTDDLALDGSFADAWQHAMERHSEDESMVAESIGQLSGVEPEQIRFENRPRSYMAWVGEDHLASWPSRGACVADAAGVTVLPIHDSEWETRSLPTRAEMLGVLRLFIESCPVCEGTVSLSQDVVESCCQRRDVVAATCGDCGSRLFETDLDPSLLADE